MAQIPPSHIPLVDDKGRMRSEWYSYFASLDRATSAASAGEVAAGTGLSGGGTVSDGVTLSLADNGVTDPKLRQSNGTSVIGRMFSSAGDVADIQATADNRVLARMGGLLVFTGKPAVDEMTVDALKLTPAAVVAAAVPSTHKVAVTVGGVSMFLLATT